MKHPLRATRLALVVALCGLAAGAAAAPPHAPDVDPSRFPYQPLPAEGSVDFDIDARSPSFEFQTGPSAFRAFRLPAATRPYLIDVRSFLTGPPDPARARVFYPVVAVLTEDFLVSRTTELEALRFDLPVFEETTAPAYHVALGVDPLHAREHEQFLVVYTPARLVAPHSLAPPATPEAAAEAARTAYAGAAPYGRLRITLRPSASAAAAPESAAEPD